MTSVPLQYDSLRTVIHHLDPNLRFKLFRRIPSIRLVERAVPLKIKTLKFKGDRELTVNGTTYKIGIYRDYPLKRKISRTHHECNINGGYQTDLDQWGFVDRSGEVVVTPGDVVPPRPRDNTAAPWPEAQHSLERQVEFFQKAIADRLKRGEELIELPETGPLPLDIEHYVNVHPRRNYEFPEEQRLHEIDLIEMCQNYSIGCLQWNLQERQELLKSDYCRQDNTPSLFTPKIQLTIKVPGKIRFHLYDYTMKLHEAVKSLSIMFFGSRRGAINIETLDTIESSIIRLPVNLKIRIKNLRVRGSAAENYEALKHILDKSSFPLQTLILNDGLQNLEDCDHQMLQSAQILCIHDTAFHMHNYLPTLLKLRNPTIDVQIPGLSFRIADQLALIQDWLQTGRPVGSRIFYTNWLERAGRELIDQIQQNIASAVVNDLSAIIPMLSGHQLRVRCIKRTHNSDDPKFTVVMKVVATQ